MPMDRTHYPSNWDEIALAIKKKARWRCQWCDRPCRRPGESVSKFADRIARSKKDACWFPELSVEFSPWEIEMGEIPLRWYIGKFTLTVAHLDHDPENPNARLAALCAPCHCRYDLRQMARKRHLKAERNGQLSLNLEIQEKSWD